MGKLRWTGRRSTVLLVTDSLFARVVLAILFCPLVLLGSIAVMTLDLSGDPA